MPDTKFIGTPKKATTHVNQNENLIFEKSSPGKKAYRLSELDVPAVDAASLLGDAVRTDLERRIRISRSRCRRACSRL
jgi:glycine dehydrogenase subunit 2